MLTELIEALQIFAKYENPQWPTHCEHDVMYICGISPDDVSEEDKEKLEELGFFVGNDGGDDTFKSYKFGSA
jgi:hypothetical protein